MQDILDLKIKTWNNGVVEEKIDSVINEYMLRVFINGTELVSMICTPKNLKELVIGFLFSESIISEIDEIEEVNIEEENGIAYVSLYRQEKFEYNGDNINIKRTVTTSCGSSRTISYSLADADIKIDKNNKIMEYNKIISLMVEFNKKSEMFVKTGGVHSSALSDGDNILMFEEDIGRHNAIDKIVGRALLEKIKLDDKIILTSGRISTEILKKILRNYIPVIISKSAPTSAAINLAVNSNLTLVGFARGRKMNIYSNFEKFKE